MLQWFTRFAEISEFLFYLGKTPLRQQPCDMDKQVNQSLAAEFHLQVNSHVMTN